jgi:hypothetical protein
MTPAFSHDEQAGSRWSQRFLRMRHLLHADTLRKADRAAEGEGGLCDEDSSEGILSV